MVVGEVDDVAGPEDGVELAGEDFGVGGAGAEDDEGARVAEDGVADGEVELAEVLVGEHHPDAVFAQLGEHGEEGEGGEGLEFVEVAVEGPSVGLRKVRPAEGGEVDAGQQQRAEEGRGVFADAPLGEVHEQNPAFVHDGPQFEALARAGQDAPERGVGQEGPHLVLQGRDRLCPQPLGVAGKLLGPETPNLPIRQPRGHGLAVGALVQQPQQIAQRRAGRFQQGEDGVPQDVLQARPPAIRPVFLEGIQQPGRRHTAVSCRYPGEGIEREGEVRVRHIEMDDPLPVSGRNRGKNALKQVAVRVEQGQAPARLDVLPDERLQQGGLSNARLPDRVGMK